MFSEDFSEDLRSEASDFVASDFMVSDFVASDFTTSDLEDSDLRWESSGCPSLLPVSSS